MFKMHSKETPTCRVSTFDDIAVENRRRMELMGIMPNNKAAEHALMQMMSCVGELATLAYRNATSLSPFEREEVHSVIGKLAVSLATIGEAFDVAVGKAALDSISEQIQKTKDTPATEVTRNAKKPPQLQELQEETGNAFPKAHFENNVLLSPTSNRDYFAKLDELIAYGPEEFERAGVRWVAPSPGGTIRELFEHGSEIKVSFANLPKYLELLKGFRSARSEDEKPFAAPHALSQPTGVVSKPIAVSAAAAAAHEGMKENEDIPFVSANPDSNSLLSPSNHVFALNSDDGRSVGVPLKQEVGATQPNNKDTNIGEIVISDADFASKVASLKSGAVSGAHVSQLNLSFSVPQGGKLVELIPNGIHVRVTSANVAEFLRLLEDKAGMQSGRVRRLESIKKLEVICAGPQGLSQDKNKFSPTHFSKDIFAPYEERTSFFIDCDASDEILPVFIKQIEEQQKNTESEYVRVVRQGDVKKWRSIIEEAKSDPSAVIKYGITFCFPSDAVPGATEEEKKSKVRELINDGVSIPVEEADLSIFLPLIEKFLKAKV